MTEKGKSQNSGILRFLTEGKLDIYLFIVINLSISSLWWLVNHITRWAGENANYVLVPLILGILISVFEVILIPKIKLREEILKGQVLVGFLGQMIADWLIYSALHNLGVNMLHALDGDYQISTMWLFNNTKMLSFMSLWVIFTFILVIPAAISLLIHRERNMKTKEKIITSWHFSMVFLGLVMGIRLGSSWSLPFYHLIYTAILFPLISQAILNIGISQEEIRFGKAPFLPLLGYLFIMGFWSSAIESHQSPHLSGNWLWLAAMAIHLTVLIGKKRGNFSKKRLRTYLWATFWGLSEISIIFIAMGNLLSGFARFRSIWVCLGVIGNVFSMEMLLTLFKDYKENNGEKSQNHSSLAMLLTFVMLLIATITTFLGVLIPYVINIYDPLSSYVTMGLAVVNIFITIIPFLHYRLSKK